VVNQRFGGDFDLESFTHRAFYDEQNAWIEMRLVSNRAQRVTLEGLDLSLDLADGEEIRTEISAKFDRARAENLMLAGGFAIREWYSDRDELFSVVFAERES
jgi:L-histidine N-alpha-methyltransferase